MLKRATIIKGPAVASAVDAGVVHSSRRATVVRRAMVEAKEQAEAIVAQARAQAQTIVDEAERAAAQKRQEAEDVGRALGFSEVAGKAQILARMEARADERALERSIDVARLLAERLLGKSVELDERTVVALAQQVLSEVKGVRQVRLCANPQDFDVLERCMPPSQAFTLTSEPGLLRGNFRIVTDVGTIEANVGPRLDVLAAKLLDSLKKGV